MVMMQNGSSRVAVPILEEKPWTPVSKTETEKTTEKPKKIRKVYKYKFYL